MRDHLMGHVSVEAQHVSMAFSFDLQLMASVKTRMNRNVDSPLPLILLTTDVDEQDRLAAESQYRVRANYAGAIAASGGLPVFIPPLLDLIEAYLDVARGVVITGSDPGELVSDERQDFERELVALALGRRIPLLGICHGMQVMGACLGGSVLRDDPRLLCTRSEHFPSDDGSQLAHEVDLDPSSRLASWSPESRIRVNSLHRHVLSETGRYQVAARAPDGVVEAIEGLGDGFCLGLQWHPEYLLTELDKAALGHFVKQCASYGSQSCSSGTNPQPSDSTFG